jgi:hypothetical protein
LPDRVGLTNVTPASASGPFTSTSTAPTASCERADDVTGAAFTFADEYAAGSAVSG